MTRMRLQVEPVDSLAFVDGIFEVPVYLFDDGVNWKSEKIAVDTKCFYEGHYDSPLEGICICEKLLLEKGGYGKLKVVFKQASKNHDNKKFVLSLSVPERPQIASVMTQPITVVRYKLVIEEANRSKYTWYKDEGGKDKCIELKVFLIDKDHKKVNNKNVPLKICLVYSNTGQAVADQNIMVLNQDSKLNIDSEPAIIKMRINEVSTRHQGQLFQLQISPDLSNFPFLGDISPNALSTPVDVKSKRNHHNKERDRSRLSQQQQQQQQQQTSSMTELDYSMIGGAGSNKRMKTSVSNSYISEINTTPRDLHNNNNNTYKNKANYITVDAAPIDDENDYNDPYMSNTDTIGNNNGQLIDGLGGPSPNNQMDPQGGPYISTSSTNNLLNNFLPYHHPLTTEDCYNNISAWSHNILAALDYIQWKPLGYEKNNGVDDYSRPLYSIPVPITVINELRVHFHTYIEDSIRVIGNKVHESKYSLPDMAALSSSITKETANRLFGFSHNTNIGSSISTNGNTDNSTNGYIHGSSNNHDPLSMLKGVAKGLESRSDFHDSLMNLSPDIDFPLDSLSRSNTITHPSSSSSTLTGGLVPLTSNTTTRSILTKEISKFDALCSQVEPPSLYSRQFSLLDNQLILPTMTGHSASMTSLDPFMSRSLFSRSLSERYDIGPETERLVHYIMAKKHKSGLTDVGLPAFDINKNLIGFYRLDEDIDRTTIPKFDPVSKLTATIIEEDKITLNKKLEDGLKLKECSYIFSRNQFHSATELVERAIICQLTDFDDSLMSL